MLLHGGHTGGLRLETRASGEAVLEGIFPYNEPAVLSDGGRGDSGGWRSRAGGSGGRPRKEKIASRAFAYRIETPSEHGGKKDIHLLSGHSYDKPLASVRSGTLDIKDGDKAVTFTARIAPDMQRASWVQDVLAAIEAGLATGISPGFRLPPKRREEVAEQIEDEGSDPENGMHNAIIRTVLSALLYEFSIVTRPVYPTAQIEARSWQSTEGGVIVPKRRHIARYR